MKCSSMKKWELLQFSAVFFFFIMQARTETTTKSWTRNEFFHAEGKFSGHFNHSFSALHNQTADKLPSVWTVLQRKCKLQPISSQKYSADFKFFKLRALCMLRQIFQSFIPQQLIFTENSEVVWNNFFLPAQLPLSSHSVFLASLSSLCCCCRVMENNGEKNPVNFHRHAKTHTRRSHTLTWKKN